MAPPISCAALPINIDSLSLSVLFLLTTSPATGRYTAVHEYGVNAVGDVEMTGRMANQLDTESDEEGDLSAAETVGAMHSEKLAVGDTGSSTGGRASSGGGAELAGAKTSGPGRGSLVGRRPSPPQERKV